VTGCPASPAGGSGGTARELRAGELVDEDLVNVAARGAPRPPASGAMLRRGRRQRRPGKAPGSLGAAAAPAHANPCAADAAVTSGETGARMTNTPIVTDFGGCAACGRSCGERHAPRCRVGEQQARFDANAAEWAQRRREWDRAHGDGAPEPAREPEPPPNLLPRVAEPAPIPEPTTLGAMLDGPLWADLSHPPDPIPTPWPALNNALDDGEQPAAGGFLPGVYAIAAPPGRGKTQWCLQVALHAAAAGTPVVYFGLEMGPRDLAARFLALHAALGEADASGRATNAVKWSAIYRGKRADWLTEHGVCHRADLRELPIFVETARPGGWPAADLLPIVAAVAGKHEGRRPLVVVDFLQLLAGDPRADLRERIGAAAYTLSVMKAEHGASVLAVSSVARDKYGADDDNPEAYIAAAKESGDVEFACEAVIVFRVGERDPDWTPVDLMIAKQRAGSTGARRLRFDGSRFWDAQEAVSRKAAPLVAGDKAPANDGGGKGKRAGASDRTRRAAAELDEP